MQAGRSAVITSTIGRPDLRECIESVRAQSYHARHFVYVNGPKYHESARAILKDYPGVHAFYLPEETGDYGLGGSMADVFAGATYLTRADWIFYLDDDNFFEPNHIESLLTLAGSHDLKWAYSLRKLVDLNGKYICDDDWCSLGVWPVKGTNDQFLVDNSCYAVSRRLAQKMSLAWTALPYVGDRCFLLALMESREKGGCTGLSTVNYRIGTGTASNDPEYFIGLAKQCQMESGGNYPWRTPVIYSDSKIYPIQPVP